MSASSGYDPDFNDAIPKSSPGQGVTLFKVLVGPGILVLLVALLLPATRSSGRAVHRAQCTNNLKQIALALYNYEAEHGALPPAYTVDPQGRPLHSWRTLILPYLDHEALYRTIDLSKPWNDPANAKAAGTLLPVFRCPAADGPQNTTTYLAIVASGGCFLPRETRRLAEITDGTGSTLMVIEAGEGNAVPWMAPVDADESLVMGLGPTTKFDHPGGMNACFVDGTVKFLKASTPAEVRRAWISISGSDDAAAKDW